MDVTESFDFDRSVEQAWRRFTLRLEDVLSMMDETEPLTFQPCDAGSGQWYIHFSQDTRDAITAAVPLVTGSEQLSDTQMIKLRWLGWEETVNGFELTVNQNDCAHLAQAAVTVLREVFLLEHPVFMDSNVLAEILQEPAMTESASGELPEGSSVLAYTSLDEVQLAAAVSEELTEVFGAVPMRDQDGDFAVRVGSAMIFIRIVSDGKEIRLFSVLVHDVSGRSRATEVINDVNAHARWVRFSLVRDKIIATMSIFASPFVPAHLRQAITEMANVSDGVDGLLAASLQGKTTFPEEGP